MGEVSTGNGNGPHPFVFYWLDKLGVRSKEVILHFDTAFVAEYGRQTLQ